MLVPQTPPPTAVVVAAAAAELSPGGEDVAPADATEAIPEAYAVPAEEDTNAAAWADELDADSSDEADVIGLAVAGVDQEPAAAVRSEVRLAASASAPAPPPAPRLEAIDPAIAGALAEAVLPRDPASGELDYSCQAAGGCPGRLYARAAPNGAADFACDRAGCDFAPSL